MDSNPNIKWCPFPGCGRAVKLPDLEDRTKKVPADTSRAVDCGNGHYFCWYATCLTYYGFILKCIYTVVEWLVKEIGSLKFLFILTGGICGYVIHVFRDMSIALLLLVFVLSI